MKKLPLKNLLLIFTGIALLGIPLPTWAKRDIQFNGGEIDFPADYLTSNQMADTSRSSLHPNSLNSVEAVRNVGQISHDEAGDYTLTVTNEQGSKTSDAATLEVENLLDFTSGLVAYFPFDEESGDKLNDASGNSINGDLQNFDDGFRVSGVVGGAYDFDGTDDFIIVPHNDLLNITDQATVSVWLNPESVSNNGDYDRVFRKDVNFDFALINGGVARVHGFNKNPYSSPSGTVENGAWQHFAYTFKDGLVQWYKNGQPVGSPIPGHMGEINNNPLVISNFQPNSDIPRLFEGMMDELGIWQRALPAGAIAGIYENGLRGNPLNLEFEPLIVKLNLIDNNTKGYYNDSIGNQLNGTSEAFPTFSDPRLDFSSPPNLDPASGSLGGWLQNPPDFQSGNWSTSPVDIPQSWPGSTETAIVYPLNVPQDGYRNVHISIGVDNGVFVWMNGNYLVGHLRGGGAIEGEHRFSVDHLAGGTNYLQILREDHGSVNDFIISVTAESDSPKRPVILSATHGGNPNGLLITFSEPVDAATAVDPVNFSLDGSPLPSDTVATLSGDGLTLTLLGSFNFEPGDVKKLVVSGISDRATSLVSIEDTELEIDYSYNGGIIDTKGLLSYWNFEGSYNDVARFFPDNASTVDDNGAAGTGVSFEPGGPSGTYGLFNGSGDTSLVEIPNSPDILAEGEDFSVTAWFRVDTFDKSWQTLVAHGESHDWRIHRYGDSDIELAFKGGSAEPFGASADSPINNGEWHHVVGTVTNSGESKLFIDGQLVQSLNTSRITNNRSTRMMIGGNPDTPQHAFRTWNGGIDEVTLWNRALSEKEVRILASSSSLSDKNYGPISIKTQPREIGTVPEYHQVELKVETQGSRTGLSYQWYRIPEGEDEAATVEGATSAIYRFTAEPSLSGTYYVVAKNWFSQTISQSVEVLVTEKNGVDEIVFQDNFLRYDENSEPISGAYIAGSSPSINPQDLKWQVNRSDWQTRTIEIDGVQYAEAFDWPSYARLDVTSRINFQAAVNQRYFLWGRMYFATGLEPHPSIFVGDSNSVVFGFAEENFGAGNEHPLEISGSGSAWVTLADDPDLPPFSYSSIDRVTSLGDELDLTHFTFPDITAVHALLGIEYIKLENGSIFRFYNGHFSDWNFDDVNSITDLNYKLKLPNGIQSTDPRFTWNLVSEYQPGRNIDVGSVAISSTRGAYDNRTEVQIGEISLEVRPVSETDVIPTPISIKTHPLGITDALEFQQVELSVETLGSRTGLKYQWYFTPEGGNAASPVNGATSAAYRFTALPSLSGNYHVVVSNNFSETTSESASVSIVPDTEVPELGDILGSPLNNSVTVNFSEPVDSATAGDVGNYSINGLEITKATVVSPTVVNLTTEPQTARTRYILSVSGVQDLAETPNTVEDSGSFDSFMLRKGGLTVLFYDDNGPEFTDFFPDNRGTGNYPDGFAQFGTGVNLTDISDRLSTSTTYFESPASGDINVVPPSNVIDHYAQVVFGYIVPDRTGNYRFGIASDDNSELYLSTDEKPENSTLIASETGWNSIREYDNPGNQSEPIFLEAGNRYYVEAIMEEGSSDDNLAVAWSFSADGDPAALTNGTQPIPADFLWSFLPVNEEIELDAPDLKIDLAAAPSAGFLSENILISWTVRNEGTAPTTTGWVDRLFLAQGTELSPEAIVLAEVPSLKALEPGQSYTIEMSVALPDGGSLIPGNYNLIAYADFANSERELNESDNSAVSPISLSNPPLPDLVVEELSVPAAVQPGIPFEVEWTIANRGSLDIVDGAWLERLSVSGDGTGLVTLGDIEFQGSLAAGETVRRTQEVVLASGFPAGRASFTVSTDVLNAIPEENEANNLEEILNQTAVTGLLRLTVTGGEISEGASVPLRATVARNSRGSQPLNILVRISDPGELAAGSQATPVSGEAGVYEIVIPGGQSSTTFDLMSVSDQTVDGSQTVQVEVSAAGYVAARTGIVVLDIDLPALSMTVDVSEVEEGGLVEATITRDIVTDQPVTVSLTSSNPSQVSPPSVATIPAGAASTTIFLLPVDNNEAEAEAQYSITAEAEGFTSASVILTVVDNDVPFLSVSLSSETVSEASGNQALVMTVRRIPVGSGALTIEPSASDESLLVTPLRITIPGGQDSQSFPVGVIDDTLANGTRTVELTAYALTSVGGQRLTQAPPVEVTVLDDDGPTLFLSSEASLVPEGLNPATVITVSRNTEPVGDLTIQLQSGDPTEATVPASVIIPDGSPSATFDLVSLFDDENDGNQPVVIEAAADGFTPGFTTVVVSDTDLPDLVISDVSAPETAAPREAVPVTYRVTNQGLAQTDGEFLTRIFLSRDPVIGDDILVAQFRNVNPLPVGRFLQNTVQAQLPQEVGRFWVVVETDAEQSISEILENNNTRISESPVFVTADYSARVIALIESAPAGTPVELFGQAIDTAGKPIPGKPVDVHLVVRGIERVLNVTTDASGGFATTFTPLPGEGGRYSVFATHPGVKSAPEQDSFRLYGFGIEPAGQSHSVIEGTTHPGVLTLKNLTDVPLNGLKVTVLEAPAGLDVAASVASDNLPAEGNVTLEYGITATASEGGGTIVLRVETIEGASRDISMNATIQPLIPRLVVEPKSLYAAMPVGGQAIVEFDVVNRGGKVSDPLTVSLPGAPWMHVAVPNPLPPLEPGATNRVTLSLTPPVDLPLGPYDGRLSIGEGGSTVGVPFSFRAMSECVGDLRIEAVDEYTYYAEGEPRLAGATVTVRDSVTQAEVAKGITDENGIFFAEGLNEDYYDIEVRAPQHTTYRKTHRLTAGITNNIQTFLSRQTVSYTWTVEPVEIEDRYRITVDSTFETVVPVPVVTIEPKVIDLTGITGNETQLDIKITNHGLIAANAMEFNWPTHPLWEFTPLIEDIGTLAARSSITVPVTIRKKSPALVSRDESFVDLGPCYLAAYVCWELVCGDQTIQYCGWVSIATGRPGCFTEPPPPPPPPSHECQDCNGIIWNPVASTTDATCDGCALKLAEQMLNCAFKFIPLKDWQKCVKDGVKCGINIFSDEITWKDAYTCAKAGISCTKAAGKSIPGPWKYLKFVECFYDFITACGDGPATNSHGYQNRIDRPATLSVLRTASIANNAVQPGEFEPEINAIKIRLERLEKVAAYSQYLYGDPIWFLNEDQATTAEFMDVFEAATETDSNGAEYINDEERALLLALNTPIGISTENILTLIERWNRSLLYWQAGWFTLSDLPSGESTDFLDVQEMSRLAISANNAITESESEGFESLAEALEDARFRLEQKLESFGLVVSGPVSNMATASTSTITQTAQEAGVCARVKIRLEQDAVMTRDAFRATLELENNDAGRLEDVQVEVYIRPTGGAVNDDLFAVRFEEADVLSGVDGGILPGNSTGRATWLLIPTIDAAPETPKQFLVGGSLSYRLNGDAVTVPIYEAPITVYPSPRLTLQYFHQRDVFADDPFTDQIEPSVPYNLAVMASNKGFGTAENFHITSAQPKIIENEKGLLIDFNIIASEVAGQPVSPSLAVDLGDIGPGDSTIARWLLTSSLQGLFIDYEATFEHVDSLGNPRLSLIDEVTIHEMNHLVRAGGIWEDGKPDFLVNGIPDTRDLPDTLYQSNGSTNHVALVENSSVSGNLSDGNLSVTLNALTPGDWVYLRVPDPGDGAFTLNRVVRSDGLEIPIDVNAWTTDRTFVGVAKPPVRENILHLLDFDSTGSYVLHYTAGQTGIDDEVPPVSSVSPLPAMVTDYFQVSWSGRDQGPLGQAVAGVAFYDIYVSTDGGDYLPWLERTPLVSATYAGVNGSSYAFYSIATDANGNREDAPEMADTSTVVGLENSPPTIEVVSTITINEGELLDLPYVVADPDTGQNLTVSLGDGAPAGMLLNTADRRIRWNTGEGNGPSTNAVELIVSDNGFPRLSATARVEIVIQEVNTPPESDPVSDLLIAEGGLLRHQVSARDTDIPRNTIRFSLSGQTPAGVSIDPNSGLISWVPSEIQGGTTNVLRVVATDDGVPPLSSEREFTVVVLDSLPDFVLQLGTTNVLSGEIGDVPLSLKSGQDMTQLSVLVTASKSGLGGLNLVPTAPAVGSVSLTPAGPESWSLTVSAADGASLRGDQNLARLVFDIDESVSSRVVRMNPSNLNGIAGNTLLEDGQGLPGKVFIVRDQPLLDARLTDQGEPQLVLFGLNGRNYQLQRSQQLGAGALWEPVMNTSLEGEYQILNNFHSDAEVTIYRIQESPAPAQTLKTKPSGPLEIQPDRNAQTLILNWTGTHAGYILEASPTIGSNAQWSVIQDATPVETTSGDTQWIIPMPDDTRFFRLRSPSNK